MKNQTGTVFLPSTALHSPSEAHVQTRSREFASWMVLVGFMGDVLTTVGSLLLAFFLRFHTPVREWGRTASQMALGDYRGHVIFLTVTLLAALFYFKLYSTGRPLRLRKVNAIVVTGSIIWFLANLGLSFELNTMPIVSRIFLAISLVCVVLGLGLWRTVFDWFLTLAPVAALLQRRILFVGWSDQAIKMVGHIFGEPKHPYKIVGCVPSIHDRFDLDPPETIQPLGAYADLKDILIDQAIDIVIVADLNPTRGGLRDLVTLCEKELVHVQIVPSCFQVLLSGLHLETTSGVPVLALGQLPMASVWNQLLKRLSDIVGALVGLLLSAPIITIFSALVYAESPGPVFYRQRRTGIDGKQFFILKIRSMKLDAEAGQRPGWTQKEDPRRLRVGAFMRRWNIDEVPQFLNVLLGEMSLVGPRPERPEFIEAFKEEIPHYNARHGIKPGITGWAQVNGFRGDTDLAERIKCDLYYMENWSVLLDVQIMLMTFFKRKNAC